MIRLKTWCGVMALVVGVALGASVPAQGASQTLTFENQVGLPDPGNIDGASIPNGYGGLNWNNFYYLNASTYIGNPSGYSNGLVSGKNVAYNAGGDGASLSVSSPGVFTFNSVYLTAAWNDGLSVVVDGYLGTTLLYSQTVIVDTSHPTAPTIFNFAGIDSLTFTSSGGSRHDGFVGAGDHFVMDDFTFTLGTDGAVPEPSSLISAAAAVAAGLGYGARRRRRAA